MLCKTLVAFFRTVPLSCTLVCPRYGGFCWLLLSASSSLRHHDKEAHLSERRMISSLLTHNDSKFRMKFEQLRFNSLPSKHLQTQSRHQLRSGKRWRLWRLDLTIPDPVRSIVGLSRDQKCRTPLLVTHKCSLTSDNGIAT